ncbi:carbohydrate kinase family protein [Pararhizobium mangrovi]|uniref:Ribokinase n=1 Tax=Pararhizobium mangrovi TaxID=2590452 RepID=A0A506U3Q5_9HYPH|nr:PfkB family carbohydrate kinase [Pararhizobium mangrovi]TPW27179.1 ribokinase [Pararhizobium mangrovi]
MGVHDGREGVLCLGRIYCDLVFTGSQTMPVLGREIFADNLDIALGGGAFITAAHLEDLARPAMLLARFGTDAVSRALEGLFEESGIDLSFLERAADAGPQVTVAMVERAERAFLSRRAGHAIPRQVDAAFASPSVRHLHIAEYATLVEAPDLVRRARRHGLTVSLDPSWDADLIHSDAFGSEVDGIDLLLPNLAEATALTGTNDPYSALTALSNRFPIVALKAGADGAFVAEGKKQYEEEAAPAEAVDTTGAGDAFNAGFLASWLNGDPIHTCLHEGIERGSLSVQTVGGAPRGKRRRVEAG